MIKRPCPLERFTEALGEVSQKQKSDQVSENTFYKKYSEGEFTVFKNNNESHGIKAQGNENNTYLFDTDSK